jgi:flavin reductase (DIM6/NTAB) family NADH-FMN oxidoreductase RutF
MISVGKKPDGTFKDTRVNIEQRPDYVIHIAHRAMLESLNASSATLPAEVSELNQIGLSTTAFPGSRLPRIEGCRLAFGCTRHSIQEIGAVPQSLILGRVKAIYLDDTIIGQDSKGRLKVHADRLDPVTRLGGSEFATFGEIVSILRPK